VVEVHSDKQHTRADLGQARRVVVKVGSALLRDDDRVFSRLGFQLARARDHGVEIVLVSSGAIALGWPALDYQERPHDLAGLQAAAAAGQGLLTSRWTQALGGHAPVAQVLLTHGDLAHRRRYLNARHALLKLLERGAIPVINENDTVSVDEIKLGDNDMLAAAVAGLVSADLVLLLTGADGMFTADPSLDPSAERLSVVDAIDDDVRAMAGPPAAHGTGGMRTKLEAAELARRHGAATVIAPGRRASVIDDILSGADIGTYFPASQGAPEKARKRWIATALRARGTVVVDAGARRAVERGASLLSVGVRSIGGSFGRGDAVDLLVEGDAAPFARGLIALTAEEAARVAGCSTSEARERLGDASPDALVHRDDLALITS
jgi:glutamate 5-kinase